MVAAPVRNEGTEVVGIMLVLAAMLCYSIATTLFAPLQQTYGALRVTLWTLVVSSALLAVPGVLGSPGSTFELKPTIALVVLALRAPALFGRSSSLSWAD